MLKMILRNSINLLWEELWEKEVSKRLGIFSFRTLMHARDCCKAGSKLN